MDHPQYVDLLRASTQGYADVLAAAPLETGIPSCPGWALVDLTRHLGSVHRWACSKLTGATEQGDEPATDGRADLLSWFVAGAEALAAELMVRDADEPCWTLYPPSVAATWSRRQALETAIHAWDATTAVGRDAVIAAPLAVSGIAEAVEDLYPRQVRLNRIPPLRSLVEIRVSTADGEQASFRLGATDAADGMRATIELDAESALLLLWKRRTLDELEVRVSGSESALRSVLEVALVP